MKLMQSWGISGKKAGKGYLHLGAPSASSGRYDMMGWESISGSSGCIDQREGTSRTRVSDRGFSMKTPRGRLSQTQPPGRGIMSAVIAAVINIWGVPCLNVGIIKASALQDNAPSIRVLEKVVFVVVRNVGSGGGVHESEL
ncbi:hypothetical protein BDZ94DRAFT_897282 [Collybia nuda]|uniref:Uncharacterized protein n=1 Tax=Collybia nuda TaxID=64659 RepID=A0A9P5Y337_9AGAR|nr:hypothetical protein BDZ94DRAFT_897282 [Collybia nuda]